MAEHVKLMGTAAKAGATMALVALIVGVAGNATGQGRPTAQVRNGRTALKLKVKGLSQELKRDLVNIETDFNFVSRLLEEEGIFYYFNHGGSGHRLLTIGGADATFLKISDANAKFLPIADANARFLQGVSGAATLSRNARQVLLSIAGFGVDVATNGDGFPSVTIDNGTGVALPAVQDQGGTDRGITLQPGNNSLTVALDNGIDQLRLQTFPAASFNRVLTLTLSINFNAAQASSSFAGQLINGGS